MSDINLVLVNKYQDATNIYYSDDNSAKLLFRLDLNFESNMSIDDDYNILREKAEDIKDTIIKGIENIDNGILIDDDNNKYNNVVIAGREGVQGMTSVGEVYEAKKEYYINTEGSNLLEILMMDNIDTTRTASIDPNEMYNIFGIEAGNFIIQQQFKGILTDNPTNIHHVNILVDKMCHNGYYMSVDRFGIKKENIGPLAKASFEETALILKNAAVFGEVDTLKGVSSSIIVGQIAKCGTGIVKLYLDEQFIQDTIKELGIIDLDTGVEEVSEEVMAEVGVCVDEGEQIRMNHVKNDGLSIDTLPGVDIDF